MADQLRARGYTVERRKSDEGRNWLVLASHTVSPEAQELDCAREALERLAREHSGEYDGHELDVSTNPV